MEALLRICYPILNPHPDGPLGEVEAILKAAVKYQMEFPIAVLTAELLSRATHAPLSVWAAACRTGLETLARLAAEHTFPAAVLSVERDSDLKGVAAWQLYRLREFWRLKGQVGDEFSFLTVPSATCSGSAPLGIHAPAFRSLSYDDADLVVCSSDGGGVPSP
ncbi:hypothetical protein BN946_scf185008.g101 [Trametes cinnabarina]|uniref:Uncharacterized protein n=1 Tax=Pycnoporus cinnabarinus TaxID=5643 RepID=A0A060SLP5_PYCCI|nr:hypothetical protein BN946_scf185008.g101 [Trametes cinnabarina]